MAQSPQFEALVYPEVFRRLLLRILIQDKWTEDDDGGWQSDWMEFALNLGGTGPLPHPEFKQEREEWIEGAVSSFCRKLQLQSSWNRIFDEEKHT